MNMSRLKELLSTWMKIDTWSTGHPLDDKRFNKALHSIFSEFGTSIDGGNISEVMNELADEHYPNLEQSYKENKIQDYAIRAEQIASYLDDTK